MQELVTIGTFTNCQKKTITNYDVNGKRLLWLVTRQFGFKSSFSTFFRLEAFISGNNKHLLKKISQARLYWIHSRCFDLYGEHHLLH